MKKSILILIGLIVVAVLGFFVYSNTLPACCGLKSGTDTAGTTDWKTYTNNEYGFEFTYPSSWGEVVTRGVGPENCPADKTGNPSGIIESPDLILAFSHKPSVGVGGSFMEYQITVTRKSPADLPVCGLVVSDLEKTLKTNPSFGPFSQKNSVEAYRTGIISGGYSAEKVYSLFNVKNNTSTVIQPKALFTPVSGSAEAGEIENLQKGGEFYQATLTFIDKSLLARPVKEGFEDFEAVVNSLRFLR